MKKLPSFKVFLSHSYRAPDINLYFFDLFREVADIQFEVDPGNKVLNVTRLERMIKNADAFIGIYPCIETRVPLTYDQLVKQSQYFLLEIDLVIRSQKPAIVFYDQRFKNIINLPFNNASTFNSEEITGPGGKPHRQAHKEKIKAFSELVKISKYYEDKLSAQTKNVIGIFVDQENLLEENTDTIKNALKIDNAFSNTMIFKAPFILNNELFNSLESLEMAVLDVNDSTPSSGLCAYLHGRFIPMLRLKCLKDSTPLYDFLYSGVEVGYTKDIIKWNNNEELKCELEARLKIIRRQVRLINTSEKAIEYFNNARKLDKKVFLSYSGKDLDAGAKWAKALENSFLDIFDYKDKRSIQIGKLWREEISGKIQSAKVGICLLTQDYIDSKYCMDEVGALESQLKKGALDFLFIVRLDRQLKIPWGLSEYQAVKPWEDNDDLDTIIENIAKTIKDNKISS